MNHDQNPRHGGDESIHFYCDFQHANRGNKNVIDDIDMDNSYDEDYDNNYSYSSCTSISISIQTCV